MFCCSTLQLNSIQFNSIQFNSIHSKRASFKCFSRVQSIGGSVCSWSSGHFSTVPTCCRSFQVVALFSSESRWRLCCGAWLTSSSDGAWSGVGDEEIWLTYLSRREWCSSRYNLFDAQRYFLSRLAFPSNQKVEFLSNWQWILMILLPFQINRFVYFQFQRNLIVKGCLHKILCS